MKGMTKSIGAIGSPDEMPRGWRGFIPLSLICLVLLSPIAWGEGFRLRVLSYNIHHGEGTDGVFDYDRLAERIRELNPDVVALQEVDQGTTRSEGVDQARRLGEMTDMNAVFGAAMPYAGGHYGCALLSRFPLQRVTTHPLPYPFGREPRVLLTATIQPSAEGPELVVGSTHLCHRDEATRLQQVQQIQSWLPWDSVRPVILAGDFNARPGSRPMQALWDSGWIDAVAPESVIDYVILRRQDGWKVREVTVVDDVVTSDHRPVLVELEWEDSVYRKTPESISDLLQLEETLQASIASVEEAIVAVDGGTGGGVLVSPDGYVLSAAHVSGYGREVRIRLADGSTHDGKSLGAFRFADAAMVKIDGDGPFPYVSLAQIGDTQVGDWCFALGHPGGLDAERGVVARMGRVISMTPNLMRSDCRILGGDSGGALFNSKGELIGIHSRIGMPWDQNYHAPIDAFLRHWQEIKNGEVLPPRRMQGRGGLGIATQDGHPGVRVMKVELKDSPLEKGDVILEFDDYLIEDDWEYLVAISSRKIGEVVRLRVMRKGALVDLDVEIRELRSRRRGRDGAENR